ncbi:uncharacterized protein LOC135702985 [Ochlerotatus camptorhynchus]|uniref:uncharacterized protein LOC135702985 n=1 Tax=Ochlerotatus camptorhynchus TaxID=644619 RepID=UPI0031DB7953
MVLNETLKAIPPQEWPSLRDVFKREWPRHQIAYNTVQNYINWTKIDPRIKQLQVLGLNDDSWRDNGTCIILDRYQMYAYTVEASNESLKRALLRIDWDYSYKIACIPGSQRLAFEETFKTLSIELLWDHPCGVYELPREECLKLELNIPEGLHVKKLDINHAVTANRIWPHRCEGSEYFLKRLAAWNPSVGLFSETGELMAWSFCWPTGAIGPLEVVSDHYRKGYGSIVTKVIAQEVAEIGLNCYGTVVTGNVQSKGMLEKLGFKLVGDCFYARNRARKLVEYGH